MGKGDQISKEGKGEELFMEGFLEEPLTKPCLPQAGVEGQEEKGEGGDGDSGRRTGLAKLMQCGSRTQAEVVEVGGARRGGEEVTGLSVVLWRAGSRGRLLNRKEA